MKRIAAGLLAPLLAFAAGEASAAQGVTGQDVMAVLERMGLEAELGEDYVGDPQIRFQLDGLNVLMNFYDCDDDVPVCESLQLEVGLDLERGTTLQIANAYNTRYRYGRMLLDDEMDPFLQYDFEVMYTDRPRHIESQVMIFREMLGNFTKAVDF